MAAKKNKKGKVNNSKINSCNLKKLHNLKFKGLSGGPGAKIPHSQYRGPGFNSTCHKKDQRSCMPQLRPGAVK